MGENQGSFKGFQFGSFKTNFENSNKVQSDVDYKTLESQKTLKSRQTSQNSAIQIDEDEEDERRNGTSFKIEFDKMHSEDSFNVN